MANDRTCLCVYAKRACMERKTVYCVVTKVSKRHVHCRWHEPVFTTHSMLQKILL